MTAHVVWIVLAAQLAAGLARAEPAPAADRPVEQLALDHLDRGVAAYRAGELVRAHAEFAEASRLAPDRPNPYRWLALTEAALGECAAARVHVESFLSRVPPEDPRVPEVAALRERCLAPGRAATATTTTTTMVPSAAALRSDRAPPAETPVIRRWWLWATIGTVAITAAGAAYALTRGGDARLPPVTCDPAGCHP